jgi:hypothetical protein
MSIVKIAAAKWRKLAKSLVSKSGYLNEGEKNFANKMTSHMHSDIGKIQNRLGVAKHDLSINNPHHNHFFNAKDYKHPSNFKKYNDDQSLTLKEALKQKAEEAPRSTWLPAPKFNL